jgi:hypothetical protein
MRSGLFFLIVILNTLTSYGQELMISAVETENEWSEGSVILNDGKQLTGLLRYDDRNGILAFENNGEARSFNPRSIVGFEFSDQALDRQRVFYTIEYEDDKNSTKQPFFFEVLKDFQTFAVISRADRVDVMQNPKKIKLYGLTPHLGFDPTNLRRQVTAEQLEMIYFMDEQGNIEPYAQVIRIIKKRLLLDTKREESKLIDGKLVAKYFSKEEKESMEKFAVANNLDFRYKEDLMKILDFCSSARARRKG